MAEDQSLSQCLTLGAEGENDASASSRHCGLDPQSRGEGDGPVILASRQYPQGPYRHSRVGGPFIRTRTIRWQHLSAASRESRRDSSETRQSTGRQGDTGEQDNTNTVTSLRT